MGGCHRWQPVEGVGHTEREGAVPIAHLLQYNGYAMETSSRFNPIDHERLELISRLPPAKRVRLMLSARELAVGLIRGRLRKQHPGLSLREINLKLLEELERAS